MSGIVLFAGVAAIGVLIASIALAIPGRTQEPDDLESINSYGGRTAPSTFRERVNQPFQVLADRSSQPRRLNGGLTLGEHLMRANLKLRPSEFAKIQDALLICAA